MRWRMGIVSLLAGSSLCLSGCAALLLGAGAAGGYAIGKDSVRNYYDLPQDHIFRQSLAVAKESGQVLTEDRAHGKIALKVQDVNVTITVKPISKKTVELNVKARNQFLLPKVDVAQDVYRKINERL